MSDGVPAQFIRDTRSALARMVGDQPIPHVVVDDFRGVGDRFKGKTFALAALSGEAEVQSLGDAIAWLTSPAGGKLTREDFLTPDGESALDFEQKVQQLARALREPADLTRPLAASADELRVLLFPAEVHVLYARQRLYQMERSPFLRARAWEEVRLQVEGLGKGSTSMTWLSSCANDTLRLISIELATRLYGPTTGSSSATSGPS